MEQLSNPNRVAGVLLHITSLPGPGDNGELGNDAFQFVDFLNQCGIGLWQVLPLGPTMSDKSPYQSTSAHAGNYELISISKLCENPWLDGSAYADYIAKDNGPDKHDEYDEKISWLKFIFQQFKQNASEKSFSEFRSFEKEQDYWLDDYALYVTLKEKFNYRSWVDWPIEYRDRNKSRLDEIAFKSADQISFVKFVQFIFYQQWHELKEYANAKEIHIFGDLPLFVSHDSADVWAHKELFKLDGEGSLLFVAGVPPDYFSETGQRWGNPVYDWAAHEVDSFNWWINRLKHQFELFDYVRIDHFRGLEAYWEIPADHETALNGEWVKAPGEKMLTAVQQYFGIMLPLIAEDLGSITDEVLALKNQFHLPGMKILQFAFDGASDNPYLPHNHEQDSVVYTGTHDNNTTVGWFNALPENVRTNVYRYYGETHESMPWLLVRSTFASTANMAIVPLQDLMALDESGRMNVPGTVDGNWIWRFSWADLDKPRVEEYTRTLCDIYNR